MPAAAGAMKFCCQRFEIASGWPGPVRGGQDCRNVPGISVGAAAIRRPSLQEQSWRPPSCRLPSGFRLLSGGGRQNADQRTRCPSSPPFALMKLVAPLTSAQVDTFSFAAIADWAQDALARGSEIISDGLACCRAVAEVGRIHRPVIVNGRRSQGSGASHCGDKYIYPARSSCELPIKIRATVL